MKTTRTLIALLMVVLPVIAAHAGVFWEDFSDGNLDHWHIEPAPGPALDPVKNLLKIENGHLAINTVRRGQQHSVSLELKSGNPVSWNSYTLTCQIRFQSQFDLEPPSTFNIEVRYSEGDVVQIAPHEFVLLHNLQRLSIHNDRLQRLDVSTYQPTEPPDGFPQQMGRIPRGELRLDEFERQMWDRWIPVKIVAANESFEFYFDNHLVAQYNDEKAKPGTVTFWSQSRLSVHLDDIAISGPQIPDIGPRSVDPGLNSAATWGDIKNSSRR